MDDQYTAIMYIEHALQTLDRWQQDNRMETPGSDEVELISSDVIERLQHCVKLLNGVK